MCSTHHPEQPDAASTNGAAFAVEGKPSAIARPRRFIVSGVACALVTGLVAFAFVCTSCPPGDGNAAPNDQQANDGDNGGGLNGDGDVPAGCRNIPPKDVDDDEETAARDALLAYVEDEGLRADHPWAVGHTMLALGPDVTVKTGANAVDFIFTFVSADESHGGDPIPYFADNAPGVLISPHVNMFLKMFLDAGVDRATERDTPLGRLTVNDLIVGAKARFNPDRDWLTQTDNLAWTVEFLSRDLSPDHAVFMNRAGDRIELNTLIEWTFDFVDDRLAKASERRQAGEPLDREALPFLTCFGWHDINSIFAAIGRGHGTDEQRARLPGLLAEVCYLIHNEPGCLREAHASRSDIRGDEQTAVDYAYGAQQRLKIGGHALETLALIRDLDIARPGWFDLDRLANICRQEIVDAVDDLIWISVYGPNASAGNWRDSEDRQQQDMYNNSIGDAAHALHALDMWEGDDPDDNTDD